MTEDREYDIMMLESQMANDELERQWRMEQLGKRLKRMQNATTTEVPQETAGPAQTPEQGY